MGSVTKTRVINAAVKCVESFGGEVVDILDKMLVYMDGSEIVFAEICYMEYGDSHGFSGLDDIDRETFEATAAKWFSEHDECYAGVRFDRIGFLIVANDRAMVKHYKDVLGAETKADSHKKLVKRLKRLQGDFEDYMGDGKWDRVRAGGIYADDAYRAIGCFIEVIENGKVTDDEGKEV